MLLPTSSNPSVMTNLKSTTPTTTAIAPTNSSVVADPITLDNSTKKPQSSSMLVALFGTTSMDIGHAKLASFSLPTSTDSAFFPVATYSPPSTSRPVEYQQKTSSPSSSSTQTVASSSSNRVLSAVSSSPIGSSQTASTSSLSSATSVVAVSPITSQAGLSDPHSLRLNIEVSASTAISRYGQSTPISAGRSSENGKGKGLMSFFFFPGIHKANSLAVHQLSSPTPSASLGVGSKAFSIIDKVAVVSAVEAIAFDLVRLSMVQSSSASSSSSSPTGEGPGGMSASLSSDNKGSGEGGSGSVSGKATINTDDYRIIAQFLHWLRRLLHLHG